MLVTYRSPLEGPFACDNDGGYTGDTTFHLHIMDDLALDRFRGTSLEV